MCWGFVLFTPAELHPSGSAYQVPQVHFLPVLAFTAFAQFG